MNVTVNFKNVVMKKRCSLILEQRNKFEIHSSATDFAGLLYLKLECQYFVYFIISMIIYAALVHEKYTVTMGWKF